MVILLFGACGATRLNNKRLALVTQLVEHRAVMREVSGSNPGQINTRDLKITEEKVLPL